MTELTLQPSTHDSFADENDKTTVKGNLTYFNCRNTTNKNCNSYVTFDLSSLAGKTIIDATLWIKAITENDAGGPYPPNLVVRRCTGAWDEATLVWANQPAVGNVLKTAAWRPGLGWKDFDLDLTEFNAMIADNKGMRLESEPDDVGGNNRQEYASSENGTAADKPKLIVNYQGDPTVTNCDPDNGPIAGGTSVTLTGTEFYGSTVTFGGEDATDVVVVSLTEITCTTPSHDAGLVDIVVTNDDAKSGTLENGFEYTAGNGGKSHSKRQFLGLI